MSSITIALLAFSLSAPAPKGGSTGSDWAQWRGPNRDGVSTEKGLLTKWPEGGPKLAWKLDFAGVGYGSPSVSNGKVILLGSEDAENGTKEFALCVNLSDGKKVWQTPLDTTEGKYLFQWGAGPRSSPTIEGDFAYVLGAKGDLLCLNVADGKKVWGKNLVTDFGGRVPQWGYSESVLLDGDKLICTPGGEKGAIIALAKKDGALLWRSEDLKDGAGYSSIVTTEVAGIKMYVQQTMSSVCGVNASNGKLLWKRADLQYRIAVIPTPIVFEDLVFVTAGYGSGCNLIKLSKDGDGIKAEKVYANKSIVNHHGGVVRIGGHIYGHSDVGGWVCLEFSKVSTADGPEPLWRNNFDKGSVTCVDGYLYCYGQSKGICALVKASPDKWDEVSRFEIPEKSKFPRRSGLIWAHPVISNGKLFLRDHEFLFCYDVK